MDSMRTIMCILLARVYHTIRIGHPKRTEILQVLMAQRIQQQMLIL